VVAHAPLAIKAGLDPAIVAAIGAGGSLTHEGRRAIVWEFSTQLRRDHGVDDVISPRPSRNSANRHHGSGRGERIFNDVGLDDA